MIRKKIDTENTLIRTKDFPSILSSQSGHRVLLGIGGNIGDVVRRFEHLFYFFKRSSLLRVIETAPIVKNPPFGYTEQGDFYNSLLLIETFLSPKALLRYLLRVEKAFGRKRLFKDGPRTLDIDIIFYENVTMETKELTLPHPGWKERASVLIPLSMMKRYNKHG
ncbi:2-amino-4-hydroxy-6-hydroxymethyldihydropteridine diphosphokinase [Sulfurovum sp. TSL1]|uniref:2-amino-4-hydroxy-6- hydroxymethyldihydropteridine diphosphokinase n=1 Tax=Sulfurovum sp. TSL1 TaxID=2826994 RepID=UPI001CC43C87|nr:2-amino-4-hydroxy-6-hydroxymethyldihydropteridine diphosphokinase [Sulfurovum sp. TSL1]GIT97451.1 2-amino-4-hydroxy-6-hydroxymethyldihydropteridine pyrophosphokinase [Sulfurovum sp. TSL1]